MTLMIEIQKYPSLFIATLKRQHISYSGINALKWLNSFLFTTMYFSGVWLGGLLWDPAKGMKLTRHHLTNFTFTPNQTIMSEEEIQKYASMVNPINDLRKYHLIKEDLPTRKIFYAEKAIHHHRKLAGKKQPRPEIRKWQGMVERSQLKEGHLSL